MQCIMDYDPCRRHYHHYYNYSMPDDHLSLVWLVHYYFLVCVCVCQQREFIFSLRFEWSQMVGEGIEKKFIRIGHRVLETR